MNHCVRAFLSVWDRSEEILNSTYERLHGNKIISPCPELIAPISLLSCTYIYPQMIVYLKGDDTHKYKIDKDEIEITVEHRT